MEINRFIDYTLLKPEAKLESVFALCRGAREENYHSVCVQPWMVAKARELLAGSETSVCCVVGFPLGYNLPETKAVEAEGLIRNGAEEIDMVANLSAYFSGALDEFRADILLVKQVCRDHGVLLKVIIESGILDFEQVRHICHICSELEPDFVKTSTGFAKVNAEVEKVRLMREVLPARIGIKASGGIRTYEDALKFLSAGANRIGTSSLIKYGNR